MNHGVTVVVGARDQTRGSEATERLQKLGIDAYFVQLDVTDQASIEAAARKITQEFGARLSKAALNMQTVLFAGEFAAEGLPIKSMRSTRLHRLGSQPASGHQDGGTRSISARAPGNSA